MLTEEEMKKAGEKLKSMRVLAGLSQPKLSERTGVSQPLISDLERGKKQMTSFAAEGLSKVFGEKVWELAPPSARKPKGYLTTHEAGRQMRPPENHDQVAALCKAGRIKGAVFSELDGQPRWLIPRGFRVTGNTAGWGRIAEFRKNNIAKRYIAGESGEMLGAEFGVHPSYPRKLVERGYPKLKT